MPYQYEALSVLTLALTVVEWRVELRQLKTNSLNIDLHYHLPTILDNLDERGGVPEAEGAGGVGGDGGHGAGPRHLCPGHRHHHLATLIILSNRVRSAS